MKTRANDGVWPDEGRSEEHEDFHVISILDPIHAHRIYLTSPSATNGTPVG